eukprot:gene20748-27567_t
MADDAVAWANSKLQGDWSAISVASQLSQSKLRDLLPVFSKGKLDNMVKVRLLMASLFISRQGRLEMEEELQKLASLAMSDDDEWVKTMGLAVGPDFSGQLDMDAVVKGNPVGNPVVRETVSHIWELVDKIEHLPRDFMPLQGNPVVRETVSHIWDLMGKIEHLPRDFMPLQVGSVGLDFSKQLDMDAVPVVNGIPVVRETMSDIWDLMGKIEHLPRDFMPLQEMYMHPDVRMNKPQPLQQQHGHFTLKEGDESGLPNFDLSALLVASNLLGRLGVSC